MRLHANAAGRALPAAARAVARVRAGSRARVVHISALYRPDSDPAEKHAMRAGVSSSSAAGGKRAIWVDCDAGIDDAQGLLLAMAHPGIDLRGISCVHGNVAVDQVTKNIARLLTLAGRPDVPFYRGCSEPLLSKPIDSSWFHGRDGLGDAPEVAPSYGQLRASLSPGLGPVRLVEAARVAADAGSPLHLVALGPLTNVAMACKLEPALPSMLGSLTVMGGAEAQGNETAAAEFNFFADVEAAAVVFTKYSSIQLVTWECTLRHALDWPWMDGWLAAGTPKSEFMRGVMRNITADMKARNYAGGWVACDAVAVAVAVEGAALLEAQDVFCHIETTGVQTRGMSLLDPHGYMKQPPNTRLVKRVCMDTFKRLLTEGLAAPVAGGAPREALAMR